jgi:hypothetical protein
MWYNGRPSLTALAGFCVMSSNINFFVQFAYKRTFARFSHNGHCAPAAHECKGRFFRANLAYGKFLLNLAASIWRPVLPKLDLSLYALGVDSKSKQKYVKFLFVKLTKYFYKKFDKCYMHLPSVDMLGIKNVPPNKL